MILHQTSRGDGPVLVLLHGLFGQSGNFGAVQRHNRIGGSALPRPQAILARGGVARRRRPRTVAGRELTLDPCAVRICLRH